MFEKSAKNPCICRSTTEQEKVIGILKHEYVPDPGGIAGHFEMRCAIPNYDSAGELRSFTFCGFEGFDVIAK